jgi:DNA repair ATPase RecN
MDYEALGRYSLKNISGMNVILGKNGCGKSHLLKVVSQQLRGRADAGLVRYISPESAGYAVYEPSVEHNISTNPGWMEQVRGNNQSENFKQQSAVLYRRLAAERKKVIVQVSIISAMAFFFLKARHRKSPGQKRQNKKAGRNGPAFFMKLARELSLAAPSG